MGNKSRRRRWVHTDGIPVKFSRLHPGGLTYGIFPLPASCPIEIRARLRVLAARLKQERKQARLTFHEIKVNRRKLAEVIDELARKAVAAA